MTASIDFCAGCGFTWEEVRSRNRLGCPYCYVSFREFLHNRLRTRPPAHAKEMSARKVDDLQAESPSFFGPGVAIALPSLSDLALQDQLSQAISQERYEEAAELRKMIQKQRGFPGSA